MRLFQAALDTCLDSPLFASLSVHGLHFTVYAPSKHMKPCFSLAVTKVRVLGKPFDGSLKRQGQKTKMLQNAWDSLSVVVHRANAYVSRNFMSSLNAFHVSLLRPYSAHVKPMPMPDNLAQPRPASGAFTSVQLHLQSACQS